MDKTKIEWTDATWNPVVGCKVLSPGCTNCYAMKLAGGRMKNHPTREGLTIDTKAGPVWNGKVRFNEKALVEPLAWKRPRDIFVVAHGDLFYEAVENDWIERVFAIMAACPRHRFQVLTKRPERMRKFLTAPDFAANIRSVLNDQGHGWGLRDAEIVKACVAVTNGPLPNVALGTSVEDQPRADERLIELYQTPAAARWVSAEPLLGPVVLPLSMKVYLDGIVREVKLDCVVVGGESQPGARPMDPAWARALRDQCNRDGVAFSFKQWGDWHEYGNTSDGFFGARHGDITRAMESGAVMVRCGKKKAGRLLDGVQHDARPGVSDA